MVYETIFRFRLSLCVLLLIVVSCSAPETVPMMPIGVTDVNGVETARAESEEDLGDASKVIISLGDKKLTVQQVKWIQPNIKDEEIAGIADWWLDNELLYAEAERRGITKEPKAKFMAELMRKKAFSLELGASVRNSVEISDEEILAYYEENKDFGLKLKGPGYLSFSHIRTSTLEYAQAVLETIKAGEGINALAREVSIYDDAEKGGVVEKCPYNTVKRRFGMRFFEVLLATRKGELIGPIKVDNNAYEVVRHEGKIRPKPLPLEEVKDRIRSELQRKESVNAFIYLLDSLKEEAADKIAKSPRITHMEKSVDEQ